MQLKTKYPGVFKDHNDRFFYQASLGIDKITGKRITKKSRKNQNGSYFKSAQEANKELTRIKREFDKTTNGYSNYNISYETFMENDYLPHYKSEVKDSTWSSREPTFNLILKFFGDKKLRTLSERDVMKFRTYLLGKYSRNYSALVFGMFRKSLDMAVRLNYVQNNISKNVQAISKEKVHVEYWTKEQFEAVISQIYIDDFYQHLAFILLWVYFNTGVRVNEGTALYWDNINFKKKRLDVSHMLVGNSKTNYIRNNYTKTEAGRRIISLDDDTLKILKEWKKRQEKEIGNVDFIFSYDGKPMGKSTIMRIIARYAKLANVPVIQAKGLRHSHVSYLINEFNVDVLVLSKRLGHSSPEITLKHYAHLWSGQDEKIAEQMSGNLRVTYSNSNQVKFNGNQAVKFR